MGRFRMPHGTVGVVKPTYRPGSLEEFIRLLPEGIGVIPLFLGIKSGTRAEFESVIDAMEKRVAELAEIGVDLIHPEGAPPFMALGPERERERVAAWERAYGVPIVTVTQTQVDAMRALGMRRIVGVTYFTGELNDMFASYFTASGFDVLGMEGIRVPFEDVGRLPSQEVYELARDAFRRAGPADGVYLLGSGWRTVDIVEPLEREIGAPVLHAVPARVWAIQRHFGVRQPRSGYGRLLAELPEPVPA